MIALSEDSAVRWEDTLFNIKTSSRKYLIYWEVNRIWNSIPECLHPSIQLSAHNSDKHAIDSLHVICLILRYKVQYHFRGA